MNKPISVFRSIKDTKSIVQISIVFVLFYISLISSLFYKLYPVFFFSFFVIFITFTLIGYFCVFRFFHPKVFLFENSISLKRIISKKVNFEEIHDFYIYSAKNEDFLLIKTQNEKTNLYISSNYFDIETIYRALKTNKTQS